MEKAITGHACTKIRKHSDHFGISHTSVCGKPALWTDGKEFYCHHHSKKGRFVFRDGDVGDIRARFDTLEELLANITNYPGMRMQHLTKSHRRDIIINNQPD